MNIQKYGYKEIEYFITNGKPVIFKDYQVPKENEDYYVEVLTFFLKYIGKEKIADHLGYCLRELIGNAKKANTKRVFFNEEKLDITQPQDYEKGMKLFKEKTISNIDYYLSLQEKHNLFVQIYYHIKNEFLHVIITNNVAILDQEMQRIKEKIYKAKTFNSIDEAMQSVFDDSEGAGFGIVIIILILRKIGISEKNFSIISENGNTHVRIAIPLSLVTAEEADEISDALIREINSIPQFPDNIMTLSKMLNNVDVDLKEVASLIKRDPALTMDLLKMSNSAHYRRPNKIEKVEIAISIIGVRGLRYLIDSIGIKKSLERKYTSKELELLWSHSIKVAQISSFLCDYYKLNEIGDFAYIGGLLHDIGKIVLRGLHPNAIDKIMKICLKKGISVNIIENLMEGANHALIGSKMAQKWNLSDNIVNIIKYHHNPLSAVEEVREIVRIIYLAHIILNKISNVSETLDVEDKILEEYNLNNPDELNKIIRLSKTDLEKRV